MSRYMPWWDVKKVFLFLFRRSPLLNTHCWRRVCWRRCLLLTIFRINLFLKWSANLVELQHLIFYSRHWSVVYLSFKRQKQSGQRPFGFGWLKGFVDEIETCCRIEKASVLAEILSVVVRFWGELVRWRREECRNSRCFRKHYWWWCVLSWKLLLFWLLLVVLWNYKVACLVVHEDSPSSVCWGSLCKGLIWFHSWFVPLAGSVIRKVLAPLMLGLPVCIVDYLRSGIILRWVGEVRHIDWHHLYVFLARWDVKLGRVWYSDPVR